MKELRNPKLYLTTLLAVVMAIAGAFATLWFIDALDWLLEALWERLPEHFDVDVSSVAFALPVCAVGGLAVGFLRRLLGEYPRSLEKSLDDFKRDRAFDSRHVPQAALVGLVSLGFGAALGPEAALVGIIGGLASLVASFVKASAAERDSVTYLGVVGALGALFGTAGAAAVPVADPTGASEGEPLRRIWLLVPGLAAAGAGLLVFREFSGTSGYFRFDLPDYHFDAVDLVYAVLIGVAGLVVALVLLAAVRMLTRLGSQLRLPPEIETLIGGIGLGLLASLSDYALFSGHDGIDRLLEDSSTTAAFLVGVAALKVAATSLCLTTGWKGGRFFPLMFAGAAAGLAIAASVSAVDVTVGLAAGMTAAVAGALRRPLAAMLLMLFFFPPSLYPVVMVAAFASGLVAQRVTMRVPALFGETAPAG